MKENPTPHREPITITLPPRTVAVTAENCEAEIYRLAQEEATAAMLQLGPESAVEIAFALLESYFVTVYAAAVPCATSNPVWQTVLGQLLRTCGLNINTQIITATPDHV